jgi:hypothetical protein
MPIIEGTGGLKTWTGDYSFAVDGGATGTLVLRSGDGPIPSGSYVVGGFVDVTDTPDSAASTATIAITVEGANDVITAAAVSGAPWSTTGRKDIIPDSTGSTALKTTAARSPSAVIAVQALTEGVFKVVLFYK